MKTASLELYHHEYVFPSLTPPKWASDVERWYQLDAYAYGLPEVYMRWQDVLNERPKLLILASPGSSNRTDFQFAQSLLKTGHPSPSKFVHTLPNSRGASLLRVMNWTGPLFCFQQDPITQLLALTEAFGLLSARYDKIWILGVTSARSEASYLAQLWSLNLESSSTAGTVHSARHQELECQTPRFQVNSLANQALVKPATVANDREFAAWLAENDEGRTRPSAAIVSADGIMSVVVSRPTGSVSVDWTAKGAH